MFTYAIYNFILFGSTWAAYLYEKSESKNSQIVFYSVAFLIPFIFLAIRYDIGTDYQNYVDYFYRISGGEIVPKEPAYLLVNYVIAYFNLDAQWLFVFFGFFFIFFAYKALPKDGFALGVFLLITTMYLYEGFSAIRQGLAIAIMAYAVKYIYEKNFKMYFFWAMVAMMFHAITAVLLLIVYPFVNRDINKFFLIFFILITFFLVKFTGVVMGAMHLVAILFPKYGWYINSQFMEPAAVSSGLGVILKISIALSVIFFKEKIVKRYKHANITINMYVFYIIFLIFHLKLSIFGRVEHAFVFYAIISITYFVNTFESRSKVIVGFIIGTLYYIIFMKYIATGTLEIDNDVYVNPYQTILERI
jgi:transmembrane protein EpsG